MKSPRLPLGSLPSLFPQTSVGVLEVARQWYDPALVRINENALSDLSLPPIRAGAEPAMVAGKMGMEFRENIALSLALNSINYQFWDLGNQGEFLRYSFEGIVGAQGMRTAFEKAWANPDSALSRARRGEPLTLEGVREVFGDIPSAQTRVDVLNEMLLSGKLEAMSERIMGYIEETGRVDVRLANEVATAFPLAYGDQVLKKAQLALSETWVQLDAQGRKVECDLTAFADYQIPNILRAMGVLEYADELAENIENYQEIPYESAEEKAIRGASLLAVEKIAHQAQVPVAAVDHYLWMRRKEAQTPFHLTFTTAY